MVGRFDVILWILYCVGCFSKFGVCVYPRKVLQMVCMKQLVRDSAAVMGEP